MKTWAKILLQPYYLDQFLLVDKVYEDLLGAQKVLSASTSRIPNCGVCCNEYNPDVTEQEAVFTAVSILFEHWERFSLFESSLSKRQKNYHDDAMLSSALYPELEKQYSVIALLERIFPNFNNDARGCPFRSNDGPHFCMIYSGRPLICRLFGAAGDRDKDGIVRFSPCKVLKGKCGQPMNTMSQHSFSNRQSLTMLELQESASEIPVMSDYAFRLQGYEKLSKIKPLTVSAIEKILFYTLMRDDRPIKPPRAA